MSDRQKKLLKSDRICVGCGSTAPRAAGNDRQVHLTESGRHMLAISCTVYRRQKLRSTRNVNICEECFIHALAMGTRSKVPGKLFAALRERLTAVYNAMRAESNE